MPGTVEKGTSRYLSACIEVCVVAWWSEISLEQEVCEEVLCFYSAALLFLVSHVGG